MQAFLLEFDALAGLPPMAALSLEVNPDSEKIIELCAEISYKWR